MRRLTVATGAGFPGDVVLDLHPAHPATHGLLRVALTLDGEKVVDAEPLVGYLHRGAEKLFEVRDYRQVVVLADRHDWLSAFANELGVVLAVERLAGIEVPVRAVWARTLLAELNRMTNHLMFLAALAPAALAVREGLLALVEEVSGGRVHPMLNRVGGLAADVPAGWTDRLRAAVGVARGRIDAEVAPAVRADEAFRAAARGRGVLPADVAAAFGVSGAVARASGLDLDLRRDEPYLGYRELAGVLRVPVRAAGDALARWECLLDQLDVAGDLVLAAADRLDAQPPGPIATRLPRAVRAPEGEYYAWTESPLGITGYYLVSRGERTPWRLKLRTPSFNNVAALPHALRGTPVVDVVTVLGSFFFVVGDIDK